MKRLLKNPLQWENYKNDLDSDDDEFYDHRGGQPEKYPCIVVTFFVDFVAEHKFVYPEEFSQ